MDVQQQVAAELMQVIKIMRDACDDAERRAAAGDSRAIQAVLHKLTWGFANASSGIETAMASLEN
jgi:hypothetical protein